MIAAGPASDVPEVTVAGPNQQFPLRWHHGADRRRPDNFGPAILFFCYQVISSYAASSRSCRRPQKKQAVDIAREIENNISGHLVTISLMNLAVGVATGIAAYLCGLSCAIRSFGARWHFC